MEYLVVDPYTAFFKSDKKIPSTPYRLNGRIIHVIHGEPEIQIQMPDGEEKTIYLCYLNDLFAVYSSAINEPHFSVIAPHDFFLYTITSPTQYVSTIVDQEHFSEIIPSDEFVRDFPDYLQGNNFKLIAGPDQDIINQELVKEYERQKGLLNVACLVTNSSSLDTSANQFFTNEHIVSTLIDFMGGNSTYALHRFNIENYERVPCCICKKEALTARASNNKNYCQECFNKL